jgi:hypothetical protein
VLRSFALRRAVLLIGFTALRCVAVRNFALRCAAQLCALRRVALRSFVLRLRFTALRCAALC